MTELGTMPPPAASESDEQALLQRLRNGEDAAFGELFELHAAAVRRLAQSLASDRSEAEDITAETFFRVLQALRRGSGPRDYVRAYLLTVARRVSWEWHGARRDVPVSDDELNFRAGVGADSHQRTAEHTLITTAFTSLPERWRTVLWQTEVEGEQPSMVATHFGLSANATAALARRARQGLRAAYLQAHLSVNRGPDSCRAVVEKLGGFTAGSVTGAEAERIKAHLLGCPSCRATQDELRDVCSSLRAHAGVLVVLVPAAAGSLGSGLWTGLGATLKGVLAGSKIKVGLALASTAAAGAVGIATGPVLFGQGPVYDAGLSGGAPELVVVPPSPEPQQQPQEPPPRIGYGVLNGRGVAGPVYHQAVPPPHLGAGEVPALPGADAPGDAVNGVTPRDDISSTYMTTGKATSPRLDTPAATTATSESDKPALTPTETKDTPTTVTPTGRPLPPSEQADPEVATPPDSGTTSSTEPSDSTRPSDSTAPSDSTEPPNSTQPSDSTQPPNPVTPTSEAPPPENCPKATTSSDDAPATSTSPVVY